jgi:replicative DNA helicase
MLDNIQLERVAPHNLEAEQALLGAILVNNDALDRVSALLEPGHFYDPLHQQIYETAAKLIGEGRKANPVTIKIYFENAQPISPTESVVQYLGRLAANATTIINVRDYGRTIRDLSVRRSLIDIGETAVNAAYDSPVDFPPREQIEEVERRLYALAERGQGDKAEVDHPSLLDAAARMVNEAYRNRGAPIGLSTGLADLDRRIGGLRRGHLVIVGGRPAMGKTSLGGNLLHAQTVPVLFFSMEMTAEEIGIRELSSETGLASDRMIRGELDEDQLRRVFAAQTKLSQRPLFVDQSSGLTIAQLATRARRAKRQRGIELIVVDYLQLMQGTKRNNRVEDVAEISVGLKALAKELDIPVVALSQLSRKVEERADKRPQLADLRESGSIEQDADEVLLVYREQYYLERSKPSGGGDEIAKWTAKMDACRGLAEIIVAKSRHGEPGIVEVQFDGPTTRFCNLARGPQQ